MAHPVAVEMEAVVGAVLPMVEKEVVMEVLAAQPAVVGAGLLFYSRTVLHHAPHNPNLGRQDMF